MAVTVSPREFVMVHYDADRIAELARDVASAVGLPERTQIAIEVDEASLLGRIRVLEATPERVGLLVEGAAFEDTRRPRRLSDQAVRDALSRVLFRVRDRLDPAFGPVPADDDLDLRQQAAWDAYALGRADRAGLSHQQARRRFHFRHRHGFSDAADAAFDRLWYGDALRWDDIEAIGRSVSEEAVTG
jgi:hypothetical protein